MNSPRSSASGDRVLLLIDDLRVGGLQRFVVDLANALVDNGHPVTVAGGSAGALWAELDARCDVVEMNRPNRPLAWIRLVRFVHAETRDDRLIVHAHQRGLALAARVGASLRGRRARLRVVEHVHNLFLPPTHRRTSFRSAHVIACGRAIGDHLVQQYGRPPASVHVVQNSISNAPAHAGPRAADGVLRILNVARVEPQKDPMRFIDVLECFTATGIPFTARWIGDGALLEQMRDEVRARRLDRVEFSGHSTAPAEELARADVVLMTSRSEGLPLAILEAMSLARAVVAPNVGAIGDVVADGVTGRLYPADATAATVASLLVDAARSSSAWGSAARRAFDQRFEHRTMVRNIEDVYRTALLEAQRAVA